MNTINLVTVAITTDASGDFSAPVQANGRLLQYRYVPDGSSPLDTGADLTISGATTGFAYVAQSNIGTSAFAKAPRQPVHDSAGAASLYAVAGEPVEDYMWIGGEQLTVTIAQGGNALSGTLYLWIG